MISYCHVWLPEGVSPYGSMHSTGCRWGLGPQAVHPFTQVWEECPPLAAHSLVLYQTSSNVVCVQSNLWIDGHIEFPVNLWHPNFNRFPSQWTIPLKTYLLEGVVSRGPMSGWWLRAPSCLLGCWAWKIRVLSVDTQPGYVKISMENGHRNSGFSSERWGFSIAKC